MTNNDQISESRTRKDLKKKSFSVPRIPGDIMVYPMMVGLLLNTFCPEILNIGSFFTATSRAGAGALAGAILLFIGAEVSFRSTPRALKIGFAIVIPKLACAIGLGLAVAFFLNDNLFGLNALSIIGGITFCSVALYTGIVTEYGDEAECGAVGILCLTIGPTITIISLGVAGLAHFDIKMLIGALLPLVIGMVLGNLSPSIKKFLSQGLNPSISVLGFTLGCGMSLKNFITGGLSGILLAAICIAIGFVSMVSERLCGGTGRAGIACGTVAGTAMTTPPALAALSESYAAIQGTAIAQIAIAVVLTSFVAPILTSLVDKRIKSAENKLSEANFANQNAGITQTPRPDFPEEATI